MTPDTRPGAPAPVDIVAQSPLFDAAWYLRTYPDVAASGLPPARHYLEVGAVIGRDPGPGFGSDAYLAAHPDAAARGVNPLVHFETQGRPRGRRAPPRGPSVLAHRAALRPAVDVVVPVHNALAHVRACLMSLAEAPTGCDVRVIVVDDASGPETAGWLAGTVPSLATDTVTFELHRLDENRGYTAAANVGLRLGRAPQAVLLNSDTLVTPHWLDGLLRCLGSDPGLGLVGPLSNAASWQNVPDLHAPGGGFAINALPDGMTPADMAALVRSVARGRYPRSPVINGFCTMIRRAVLDAVGYLDEDTFPVAYGEETDLCLRAADAGFALAYADDTYVYHAKSQSFGPARRTELSDAGLDALRAKHGADRIAAAIRQAADCPDMAATRRRIARALDDRARPPAPGAADWLLRQRVLFLLPVGAGGGGAHSVVQEVCAMRALGVTAAIGVDEFSLARFRDTYADIPGVETLFIPLQPGAPVLVAQGFDVVVATLYSTIALLAEIVAAAPQILPAYYAQDYEPLFFTEGTDAWQEARASYTRLPGMPIFAKTDWIRDQIETVHGVPVAKVSPSLDHDVYSPVPRAMDGPLRVTAMIRPGTPRRGAGRTMDLLSRLHSLHRGRVEISLFGCDRDDPGLADLRQDVPSEMLGTLTRPQVAALLQRTDIFVDMSDFQAFGRTALEAMACGAVALVPAEGGSDEYAIDGINAMVADTMDVAACLRRLDTLIRDPGLLDRMRLAALDTAATFTPRRAALSELSVLAAALARHRERHRAGPPDDARRGAVSETPDAAADPPLALSPAPAFADPDDPLAGPALGLPAGPLPRPLDPAPDIGVHLHLHYPDLLPELTAHLAQIPAPFRLYVSTPADSAAATRRALAGALARAELRVDSFPNRGRDIGPLVAGFGPDLARHDVICHIHSKRSPHNAAKDDWRRQLLGTLLHSPAAVAEILSLFQQNPHLGLVFPEYHAALAGQIGWGTNLDAAQALARRLDPDLEPDPGHLTLFPAGSMFWARGTALAPVFDAGLGFDDFPPEQGQIDGTPAHAIERLLGEIAARTGHGLLQIRIQGGGPDADA